MEPPAGCDQSTIPRALRERLESSAVLAVLVIDRAEDAVPVARALIRGGINAMELTLRTPAALDALRRIRAEVPEMLAGIGTIVRGEQVEQVLDAGGQFGVAPGTHPEVVHHARKQGLPFAPGVITPSDIETALSLGCHVLKLFPAGSMGGLPYLQAVAAPYEHLGVRFVPLGGVNERNLTAYLTDPRVLAIGGSWLAPRDLIAAGDWDEITHRAKRASQLRDQVRGG